MERTQVKRISSALLILAISATAYYFLTKTETQAALSWHQLSCEKIQNVEIDVDSRESGQRLLKAHSERLRIKAIQRNISQEDAAIQLQGMEATLQSYYVPRASPYIGLLTRESDCEKKFLPVKLSSDRDAPHAGYLMYANARLSAGACSEDQALYSMLKFMLYCRNSAFEVTVVDSNKDFTQLKDIFHSCACK